MKIFSTKAQRHKGTHRVRFVALHLCVEKLVAIAIALSFFAMLVPVSSASSDKANTMACCVGHAAGHCDSGIPARTIPQPTSEPLCGLDNPEPENDGITIVAESAQHESHHSLSRNAETTSHAAESIALSQPCPMDCGACTASSARQQRRERGVLQPGTNHQPSLTILARFEHQQFFSYSSRDWEQTSPRGPPADLIRFFL